MQPNYQKLGLMGLLLVIIIVLPGCSAKSPGEKAFQYLEKSASLEAVFNKQQIPLVKEEQSEQSLYKDIMNLDMSHFDQIKSKSRAALKSINERKQLIEKEKESLDQSDQTFKKAIPLLNQVKDSKSAPYAKALIKDMNTRYNSFQHLYTYYTNSLNQDKALFTLLQTKNLTVEKLQKQLAQVNKAYQKINQEKDTFNKETTQFNKDKLAFYKSMNISGEHSG